MDRTAAKLLTLAGGLVAALATVLALRKALGSGKQEAPAPPAAAAVAATPEPVTATPPIEVPGPSVTPPGGAARDETEDTIAQDLDRLPGPTPIADLIADEEAAAAAEAAAIGGTPGHAEDDPAMQAVAEGGGGEAEGFELAEEDLVENASHGDGAADPIRDRLRPETESDGAVHGDPDTTRDADADTGIDARR